MCTGGGGGAPSPEPWEKKAENRNITDLNGREIFIELSGSPNLSKYEPFSKLDVAQLILALSETVAPFLGSKLGALCYLYIANTGLYNRSCIFQYCPLDGKIDHFFFFSHLLIFLRGGGVVWACAVVGMWRSEDSMKGERVSSLLPLCGSRGPDLGPGSKGRYPLCYVAGPMTTGERWLVFTFSAVPLNIYWILLKFNL